MFYEKKDVKRVRTRAPKVPLLEQWLYSRFSKAPPLELQILKMWAQGFAPWQISEVVNVPREQVARVINKWRRYWCAEELRRAILKTL